MNVFYNETFDIRIAIDVQDFHAAVEKLREYLTNQSYGSHKLTVNDFEYENVDVVLR